MSIVSGVKDEIARLERVIKIIQTACPHPEEFQFESDIKQKRFYCKLCEGFWTNRGPINTSVKSKKERRC